MTNELQVDPTASVPPTSEVAVATPRHSVRRVVTWVLVVLFALLTPITLMSAWAVKTVTNTDRYVATLQPLVDDPVITNFVANKATTALFDQLNVQEKVANLLPGAGDALAAPLTAQLESYTEVQMRKVVSSQWFSDFWRSQNRYMQATALALLTGKTPAQGSTARKVVVGLSPVLIQAIDELDKRGVTVFNPIKQQLQANRELSLQLFSNKQVQKAQGIFNMAVNLRLALLIGTPLIGLLAILIAVKRRRAALRVVLGGIIGCLVLVVGLAIGRWEFMNAVPPNAQLFAEHVLDALMHYLRQSMYWTLGILTVAAAILWFFGDSTWAVTSRRLVRGGGHQLVAKTGEIAQSEKTAKALAKANSVLEASNSFVRRNLKAMRWVGVGVAAIFLLGDRTPSSILWTLILLGLYQVVISIPWTRKPAALNASPDEDADEPHGSGGAAPTESATTA